MSPALSVEVPSSLDGLRVDKVVATLTGLSRGRIAALVAAGEVVVDGVAVRAASRTVAAGSRLEVAIPPEAGSPETPAADPSVPVVEVYADADLVVVDKPAGLVVHPGAGVSTGTLVSGLVARYPEIAVLAADGTCDPRRPGIVHRLDKGTSGLLVVARSAAAYRVLTRALAERSIRRRYRALVWGAVPHDEGVVDAPVGRALRDRTSMAVTRSGRPAITRYGVRERFASPEASLLDCELETGRTHQIRVHLAALGHPVVGDARYGGTGTRGRDPERVITLGRPFLHAAELHLRHPVTDEPLTFRSDLPDDLEAVLSLLRSPSPRA